MTVSVARSGDASSEETRAIKMLESQIVTEEVSYEVGGTKLKGFMADEQILGGKRPGVLVVHEWWGHNDYVRTRARILAKMGYTAFALTCTATASWRSIPRMPRSS